jgi:hypothetical protein
MSGNATNWADDESSDDESNVKQHQTKQPRANQNSVNNQDKTTEIQQNSGENTSNKKPSIGRDSSQDFRNRGQRDPFRGPPKNYERREGHRDNRNGNPEGRGERYEKRSYNERNYSERNAGERNYSERNSSERNAGERNAGSDGRGFNRSDRDRDNSQRQYKQNEGEGGGNRREHSDRNHSQRFHGKPQIESQPQGEGTPSTPTVSTERPKLMLLKPTRTEVSEADRGLAFNSKIFGDAKPRDEKVYLVQLTISNTYIHS